MSKIVIAYDNDLLDVVPGMVELVEKELTKYGYEVRAGKKTHDTISNANNWPADYYLALRLDKQDFSALYAGKEGSKSFAACKLIVDAIGQIDDVSVGGMRSSTTSADVVNTTMVSAYINLDLDGEREALVKHMAEVATAIAYGVDAYFELYAAPDAPATPETPTTPTEPVEYPTPYSDDAELGAALRVLIRAWKNG